MNQLAILACIRKGSGSYELPEPPKDSSPCIVMNCDTCNHEMWVSERKIATKEMMDKKGMKSELKCMQCAVIISEGKEYTQIDIAKNPIADWI